MATDVAARGLDVERISHVINYDVGRPGPRAAWCASSAVAGEAGIPGYPIGAIDIHERVAFVEVPHQSRGMSRSKAQLLPVW